MGKVIITAVTHRPEDRVGSFSDKIINSVEQLNWTHVYPKVITKANISCWNILGFFRSWQRKDYQIVDNSYSKIKEWSFYLSEEDALKLEAYWDSLIGRGYGVGKIIFLVLYRLTGWKWIANLSGVICSGAIALGLSHIKFINSENPEIFGLQELEKVLDSKYQSSNINLQN